LRRVAALAPGWLAVGGVLLSEIAEGQGADAVRVLTDAGLAKVRLHPARRGQGPPPPGRAGPPPGRGGGAGVSGDEEQRGPVRQAAEPAGEGSLEDEARVIPVSKDEAMWDGLLEVGAEVIARGGLVVLPTDTVYGVGCAPFSSSAVAALFAAQRRGRDPRL